MEDKKNPPSPGSILAEKARAWLSRRDDEHRLRKLSQIHEGDGLIDLTHNDYLGLRADPFFRERLLQATRDLPPGAGASRLLGGEYPIFQKLEETFSAFKGAPATLFFGSGYAANEGLITSLSNFTGSIFSDQLIHASMIDGIRLSKVPRSRRLHYPHLDLNELERYLSTSKSDLNLILTESLFSMDGDIPNLDALRDLARNYRGILVVDEAHAIGCYGSQGNGLCEDHEDLITVNTCGKGLGLQGALVSGPDWLKDIMINMARPFIFTTAPSPWIAAGLAEAIPYVSELQCRRDWLHGLSSQVREQLKQSGFNIGQSTSHIIPMIVGSDHEALKLQTLFKKQHILVKAIRPPTVPKGTARVRLSLHAGITESQLKHLLESIYKLSGIYK